MKMVYYCKCGEQMLEKYPQCYKCYRKQQESNSPKEEDTKTSISKPVIKGDGFISIPPWLIAFVIGLITGGIIW